MIVIFLTPVFINMSFDTYKDVIEEGDTVIIYVNIHSMYALEVKPEKENKNGEITPNIFQTSYGALKVKELIGQRFGTKIQLSRGYAYALYPTPDLWTRTLPHRTQILYATDISLIILQLELKPGSVVVESGTGSGSLAHSLVRTIAPTGHLHTFGKLNINTVEWYTKKYYKIPPPSHITIE